MKYSIAFHPAGAEYPEWDDEDRVPLAATDPLPNVGDAVAVFDQYAGPARVAWRVSGRHFTYLRTPEGEWSCTVVLDVVPEEK